MGSESGDQNTAQMFVVEADEKITHSNPECEKDAVLHKGLLVYLPPPNCYAWFLL